MAMLLGRVLGALGMLVLAGCGVLGLLAPSVPGLQWLTVAGLASIGGWLFLDWEAVHSFFNSRGGRSQTASWVLVILVTAIGGLLLHLAEANPKRWDGTEGAIHSLQDRTRSVLQDLPSDRTVTAVGYFVGMGEPRQEAARRRFEGMMQAARSIRPGLSFELVDPDANPTRAMTDEVTSNGTVLLTLSGGGGDLVAPKTERLQNPDEQDLVNALVRLASNRTRAIYFTTGHGELALDDKGATGLGLLAGRLTSLGLQVRELNTLREATIPEDAAALVVAGPRAPLTPAEAKTVQEWVDAGGSLLVAAEPRSPGPQAREARATGLEEALASWGIVFQDDLVFDEVMRRAVGDASFPLCDRYSYHQVTDGLRLPLLLHTARSVVDTQPDPELVTVFHLVQTSEAAWGETNLDADVFGLDDQDHRGPVTTIALAELHGETGTRGGRVLAAGDADWLSDGLLGEFGNLDFAIRAFGMLAEEDDLVELPPRDTQGASLSLSFLQELVVILLAVLLVPGAVGLGGGIVWAWRSRL